MAFVNKKPRDFSIKKDNDGVGPGSYVGHNDFGKKQTGYAPFSSMTERNTIPEADIKSGLAAQAPGPGFYSPPQGFEKIANDVKSMKTI